jgi:iron complex transport system ATP-binding protein
MLIANDLGIMRDGRQVVANIDLALAPGQMLGVLGPNGAGKSTLMAALCGELAPTHGEVLLDDIPLNQWHGPERARRLAVLPQSSTLSFAFKVEEVVAMGRLPHESGQQRDGEIIQHALEARALAQAWAGEEGQVLLLDEPTSALDPLHQHTTLLAVRAFADRGGAVMVILHDLNLAARYCDRLLLLSQGLAYLSGTPQQVLTPEALMSVFGLDVLVQPHPERGHPLVITR